MYNEAERRYLADLREQIAERLNQEEVRTLCFDLGLDYDDLRGAGRAGKIRELVSTMARSRRLEELTGLLQEGYPRTSWPAPPRSLVRADEGDGFAEEQVVVLTGQEAAGPSADSPSRRIPFWPIAVIALVIIVAAGIILWLLNRDTTPPRITGMSKNPSLVTESDMVQFTVLAEDDKELERIEILINDEFVARCETSPCVYEGGPYPARNIIFEAEAYDTSGNHTRDIDTIAIVAADGGQPLRINSLTVQPTNPTENQSITFRAATGGQNELDRLEIWIDNSKEKECDISPCVYSGGPFAPGDHEATAVTYDAAGATDSSSVQFVVVEAEGGDPPQISELRYSPDDPTSDTPVRFTVEATDDEGLDRIEIWIDGKIEKQCNNSPCEFSGGPFDVGSHEVQVATYDSTGLSDAAATSFEVVKPPDEEDPRITFLSFAPQEPDDESKVRFSVEATDNEGIDVIEIWVDGQMIKKCSGSPCIFSDGPYLAGDHQLRASVFDGVGFSDSEDLTFHVTTAVDDVPPEIRGMVYFPERPHSESEITFSVEANDDQAVSRIEIWIDDAKRHECAASFCEYTGGPYEAGSLRYWAVAYDKAGNYFESRPRTIEVEPSTGAIIRGRVLWCDTPVPNATVYLRDDVNYLDVELSGDEEILTNNLGNFVINNAPEGSFLVSVSIPPDFNSVDSPHVTVVPGGDVEATIRLAKDLEFLEPSGNVLNTRFPAFRWQDYPEVVSHALKLYREAGNQLLTVADENIVGTEYAVGTPLSPGEKYRLYLEAYDAGGCKVRANRYFFSVE